MSQWSTLKSGPLAPLNKGSNQVKSPEKVAIQ